MFFQSERSINTHDPSACELAVEASDHFHSLFDQLAIILLIFFSCLPDSPTMRADLISLAFSVTAALSQSTGYPWQSAGPNDSMLKHRISRPSTGTDQERRRPGPLSPAEQSCEPRLSSPQWQEHFCGFSHRGNARRPKPTRRREVVL